MARKLDQDDIADWGVEEIVSHIVGGDGSAEDKIKELRELHENLW